MKTIPYLASWLVFSALLLKATVSDTRRPDDKRSKATNCSPHTGMRNCKMKIVRCGQHFLDPDSEVAIASHRLTERNPCKWNFKTLEDYDLRVACRTTLQGPPECRTSHLVISDGSNRRMKLCSSIASAGMTSKTGDLVIGFQVFRRKAAGRLKYECTVAAVKSAHKAMFTVPPPSDTVLPVSRCKCGRTNSALRIVGGNQVEPNEYPWQVALFRNNETSPFCGVPSSPIPGFLRLLIA
ncbi:uncharacterized protein [Macrobrachium rosenbergii]|uniref:uncharacterized protein n=1 Tax=Macrobrachium rosenbergii TaxID=79674 RepID=UPI0034D543A4